MQIDYRDHYVSTRGSEQNITASQAIIAGLAKDGGLYVPSFIRNCHFDIQSLLTKTYSEVAQTLFEAFLDDFSPEQIKACVRGAYQTGLFDDAKCPVKVQKAKDRYFLELYHGPTCAFKDMALTILPHFMTKAVDIQNVNREIVILTATSGDTGKAALSGFCDVPGIDIIVYYPKDGVSAVQEKQMLTQGGDNTCVVGVRGNFDDTQNGVKKIFSDQALNAKLEDQGFLLSSANSINIGRLLPQVVYYYYSYCELVRNDAIQCGDPVNFVVPTGNFGDILAGYYAALTGLPVHRLICASNANRVLTDFFETGEYNRNRDFYKTMSPSMDILISSNLERLLYDVSKDTDQVSDWMATLQEDGHYTIPEAIKAKTRKIFWGGCANEEQTAQAISDMFKQHHYLIDPHTAVASHVYDEYLKNTADETTTVVLSTASPYKFANHVYRSIFGEIPEGLNDFDVLSALSAATDTAVPKPLADLANRPNRHNQVCSVNEMDRSLQDFLTRIKA
jgi:threonine synthase